MSKKLHRKAGHIKVLAKNGLNPYFSVNCPCDQPLLTGHYFINYIQFNMYSNTVLRAYNADDADTGDFILQTDEYTKVNQVTRNWKPSAILNPQTRFYHSFIDWDVNGMQSLWYRTRQLEQTNDGFRLTVPLLKENRWWNNIDRYSIVSGNATSGVLDNYNLSTCVTTIDFITTQPSGFLSSLIVNNFDNSFKVEDFITVSGLNQFALSAETDYPIIQTNYMGYLYNIDYIPVTKPCQAAVQYYAARIYKGSQEGYIFTFLHPTLYTTQVGYERVEDAVLAGEDNIPIPGKTYYLYTYNNGSNFISLRKEGNKYYGYSNDDQKTIIEYPASSVQSTVIEYDDASQSILKITTGISVWDEYQYQYSLLSTTDGFLSAYDGIPIDQFRENQFGQYYSNYTVYVDGYQYYGLKINGESGQYYLTNPYEEEIIGDINYTWEYYVCFPKDYESATSTATLNVYKFGYYYDDDLQDWKYTSASTTSTTIITATVSIWPPEDWQPETEEEYDNPPAEPTVRWDSDLSCFFYTEGGGDFNHQDYLNMSFVLSTGYDINHQVIYTTFYIYKAPAWGVLYDHHYHMRWDSRYTVTGDSFNSLQCWRNELGEPTYPTTISTGWYISHGEPNNISFFPLISGQNYWWIPSGEMVNNNLVSYEIPLTGGDVRNPQKSIAVEDSERPPNWYFYAGDHDLSQQDRTHDYYAEIESGKYIALPKDAGNWYYSVGIVRPIYYDSYYGHVIEDCGHYYLNNLQGVTDEYYLPAKEMINDHSYDSTRGFALPFIKYVEIEYHYNSCQSNPAVGSFISPTYYDANNPTSQIRNEVICNSSQDALDQIAIWGGGYRPHSSGEDYQYKTRTQRFEKLTQAEIDDPFVIPTGIAVAVDKRLSTAMEFIDGLYCQILTGFWIQSRNDYYSGPAASVCGIRKHGYFNQLLSFNTEYKFGYDLSNVDDLDALLSSDDSICYTLNSSNKIVETTVANYWNNIKSKLTSSTKIGSLDYNDFWSMSEIRVISAHYSI